MSLSPLTILKGVGGREATKVFEGDEDGHILIAQENKVMVLKLSDACILQTWYSASNQSVITAKKNQDTFENCTYVVAYDGQTVAKVNNLGSKLAAFEKKTLKKGVFDLVPSKGDHLVFFKDGSVGSLKSFFQEEDEDMEVEGEDDHGEAVLQKDEHLLRVELLEDNVSTVVLYVVEKGTELYIVKSRLGIASEGSKLTSTTRKLIGKSADILSWDIYNGEDPYIIIWKKSGEILYSSVLSSSSWREVLCKADCYDAEIAAVSDNHFAVMYSKRGEDMGSLEIISIPFQVVSSQANLKTTIHKGRGLYFVHGYLFVVGGGTIAFCSLSGLHKQLDQYLGVNLNLNEENSDDGINALQLYMKLPSLYKKGDIDSIVSMLQKSIDVPEDLLVDYLDYITDEKSNIKFEEQKGKLREILNRDYSENVLVGELSRLNISQSLLLLETVCTWLDEDRTDNVFENRMLKWIEFFLGNNFVQTVLAKDEHTLSTVERVYKKVSKMEKELETYSTLEATLHTISTFIPPTDSNPKLPYSMQIMEL